MHGADIAALLALGSALCVATGDVLQQRAANRIAHRGVGRFRSLVGLACNRKWQVGVLLLGTSIVLQAAALGRGSVLLVQALLMLSLLFALSVNAKLTDRPVRGGEWLWAGLLTIAVIVVVTVGNPQAGRLSASLHTWSQVGAVIGPIMLGCLVIARRTSSGEMAAVMYALFAGSMWGAFAVLTKEVVARLANGYGAVLHAPEFFASLAVAVGGFIGGQLAFRAGPLTASMPALQMAQPVMAAVLGVVVLDETLDTDRIGLIAIGVALIVMAVAIFQLARIDARLTRQHADTHSDSMSSPVASR
ncbi:DMT family transporter [Candidatus Mycobacterium wuenschmannii]|uniref:DMT family transporter n=1 Tax=Candidatus Mycobacterium wuenschmannii TaxID=3027808 RepID=A0ABY8W0N5_9MYCO|nr:DMT family transporter [Candidatus Mycobacterium wuenschmannii]WIM88012.1 DMT family transporter [Candidatus Mycobacterium wuenschmannii]